MGAVLQSTKIYTTRQFEIMLTTKHSPRLLSSTIFAVPMALATSTVAWAREDVTFDLYNQTSVNLVELYISPSNIDYWEEDILGNSVVRAGQAVSVTIADGRETCIYDIQGVFADSDIVEDYQIDICQLESYSFIEE